MASDPALAGSADPAAVAAPEVTVVVPVLNEQATVEPLYDGIVTTLQAAGIAAELIFVDDGSTDGTFAILERLHAADPSVRVVKFKRNFGQHPAMHAGIARARGRIVVTMDGDLQNQPADIPRLVAAMRDGRRRGQRPTGDPARRDAAAAAALALHQPPAHPPHRRRR